MKIEKVKAHQYSRLLVLHNTYIWPLLYP